MTTLFFRNILSSLALLAISANVSASPSPKVCSQLINLTNHPMYYSFNQATFNSVLMAGEQSSIYSLPDATRYKLLNGEITVYAGQPQITKNGDFTLQFENADVPMGSDCVVFYKLRIYSNEKLKPFA